MKKSKFDIFLTFILYCFPIEYYPWRQIMEPNKIDTAIQAIINNKTISKITLKSIIDELDNTTEDTKYHSSIRIIDKTAVYNYLIDAKKNNTLLKALKEICNWKHQLEVC